MILVLGNAADPVAERVIAGLRRRGASLMVLNPAAQSVSTDLRCALSWQGGRIRQGALDVAVDDIDTVWWWRPGISDEDRQRATARLGDAVAASYVEDEWWAVVADALTLAAPRFVPALPAVMRVADHKLAQLRAAARLGLRVPQTLVTNDGDEALAFAAACDGDVIVKPPSTAMCLALKPVEKFVYTRTLKPRDWASLSSLSVAPVMLQRRVQKRVELRVSVVGERVFAAAIHSQATRRTRIDWRQYDEAHTPISVHALPDETRARCVALVRQLGLRYGAIDLILTPDGEYVFLEINPNGQWQWIEQATGLPITDALCDELVGSGAVAERAA